MTIKKKALDENILTSYRYMVSAESKRVHVLGMFRLIWPVKRCSEGLKYRIMSSKQKNIALRSMQLWRQLPFGVVKYSVLLKMRPALGNNCSNWLTVHHKMPAIETKRSWATRRRETYLFCKQFLLNMVKPRELSPWKREVCTWVHLRQIDVFLELLRTNITWRCEKV